MVTSRLERLNPGCMFLGKKIKKGEKTISVLKGISNRLVRGQVLGAAAEGYWATNLNGSMIHAK